MLIMSNKNTKLDFKKKKKNQFLFTIKCNLPLVSPCSPITHAWQEVGAKLSLCESRNRKRAESKLVPLPITRFLGKPDSFQATYVSTSTGFDTMIKIVLGLYFTSWGMIPLKMSVLRCTRLSRDSPSFWRAPAVTMQTLEFAEAQ